MNRYTADEYMEEIRPRLKALQDRYVENIVLADNLEEQQANVARLKVFDNVLGEINIALYAVENRGVDDAA